MTRERAPFSKSRTGFTWGGATVVRVAEFRCCVVLEITTKNGSSITARVTPSGRMTLYGADGDEINTEVCKPKHRRRGRARKLTSSRRT